jgi:hypothetical protein
LVGGLQHFPEASCDPNPCQGACCRYAGFPPQWLCTDVAQQGCVGTWFGGKECGVFDCEACIAEGVRSYKEHGATGELYLDMGTSGGIEPRLGGIAKLEVDLDNTLGFTGGVTVNCTPTAWAGTVTVDGPVSGTVTLGLDPPLPNEAYCHVQFECGAVLCVRTCEGDLNQSGSTTASDALSVKIRFGNPVTDANAMWDFDCSGAITAADNLAIKIRFGFITPDCP